jgi:hypothetical protein
VKKCFKQFKSKSKNHKSKIVTFFNIVMRNESMFNEIGIRANISQLLTFRSLKISALKNLKIQSQKILSCLSVKNDCINNKNG